MVTEAAATVVHTGVVHQDLHHHHRVNEASHHHPDPEVAVLVHLLFPSHLGCALLQFHGDQPNRFQQVDHLHETGKFMEDLSNVFFKLVFVLL